ncbi:hypothetical protein BJ546DRAFT_1062741 [Cryomyces antarcticus]|uniref:FHA domain-containing protein n=1 Tax=Cryomyces antarcticus TaxID=329879 RepID=A0ABR0KUG8_9PEZI|nr:hypothetical protein LTR60_001204 [Cryomyces antarcticus]KAK5019196.1 hypothetical protein LTR39_000532 [Cryomyces antarcticus]KAK5131431.1 hypothetical protein LTR16_000781 [Cryomyces antarcticus]
MSELPQLRVTLAELDSTSKVQFPLRDFILTPAAPVTIGRSSKSELKRLMPAEDNAIFDCPVMSRQHAVLRTYAGKPHLVSIKDLGSMHGTFVNEQKIAKNVDVYLYDGDSLKFGINVVRGEGTYDGVKLHVLTKFTPREHLIDGEHTTSQASATTTESTSGNDFILPRAHAAHSIVSYQCPSYGSDSEAMSESSYGSSLFVESEQPDHVTDHLDSISAFGSDSDNEEEIDSSKVDSVLDIKVKTSGTSRGGDYWDGIASSQALVSEGKKRKADAMDIGEEEPQVHNELRLSRDDNTVGLSTTTTDTTPKQTIDAEAGVPPGVRGAEGLAHQTIHHEPSRKKTKLQFAAGVATGALGMFAFLAATPDSFWA